MYYIAPEVLQLLMQLRKLTSTRDMSEVALVQLHILDAHFLNFQAGASSCQLGQGIPYT